MKEAYIQTSCYQPLDASLKKGNRNYAKYGQNQPFVCWQLYARFEFNAKANVMASPKPTHCEQCAKQRINTYFKSNLSILYRNDCIKTADGARLTSASWLNAEILIYRQ